MIENSKNVSIPILYKRFTIRIDKTKCEKENFYIERFKTEVNHCIDEAMDNHRLFNIFVSDI